MCFLVHEAFEVFIPYEDRKGGVIFAVVMEKYIPKTHRVQFLMADTTQTEDNFTYEAYDCCVAQWINMYRNRLKEK